MLSVARLVSFWRCIPVQYNCQKSSNFQGLSHFSRIFGKNDKIPGFFQAGKTVTIFPGFPGFPGAVGTLISCPGNTQFRYQLSLFHTRWVKVAFGICCLGKTCTEACFDWRHDLPNTTRKVF